MWTTWGRCALWSTVPTSSASSLLVRASLSRPPLWSTRPSVLVRVLLSNMTTDSTTRNLKHDPKHPLGSQPLGLHLPRVQLRNLTVTTLIPTLLPLPGLAPRVLVAAVRALGQFLPEPRFLELSLQVVQVRALYTPSPDPLPNRRPSPRLSLLRVPPHRALCTMRNP